MVEGGEGRGVKGKAKFLSLWHRAKRQRPPLKLKLGKYRTAQSRDCEKVEILSFHVLKNSKLRRKDRGGERKNGGRICGRSNFNTTGSLPTL